MSFQSAAVDDPAVKKVLVAPVSPAASVQPLVGRGEPVAASGNSVVAPDVALQALSAAENHFCDIPVSVVQ